MTTLGKPSRREILRAVGAGGAWALLGPWGCGPTAPEAAPELKDLVTKQEVPLNAEPRLEQLVDSWLTPHRYFYVRGHAPVPSADAATFRLALEGLVGRPLTLNLEELQGEFSRASLPATMQCAGNRRSEHSRVKTVGGVQWDAGAIGNAEWRGPRLADLLKKADVRSEAKHVWFEGLDEATVQGRNTRFGASIPLEKALRPETLVAVEMNGRPLSPEHGYPVRMVVPGYIGARSVKWLHRIVVSDRPSDNLFSARDYKLFPPEVTAETAQWEERDPIYEFVLSSAICSPRGGESVPAGKVRVRGYAIPPGGVRSAISKVEVSPDGGQTWLLARLVGRQAPFTWRLWEIEIDLARGERTLAVRATDTEGRTQPQKAAWNFKGYLHNGWHQVTLQVA